ncbi:putative L-type lectin-domain containing receptor kinase I.11 [Camellia lanceoleosa]|uniref:L-type lectin-domain containing receptor kinase I.11 n=1 Tax=Camellia lanceoleosa TaxID=1840588 RepID=A0ACC0HP40_9ERIC|nr:putative L-type lectin-domain containing receptor kinase I.11 [Camellia lanceoleosa]
MPTTTLSVSFLILLHLYLKFMALAEDENQFIYNGFHGANLHLDGDAQIHRNGLLQLTNTSVRQSGHAFYPLPIRFNATSSRLPQGLSFSTNFIFAMVYEIENYSGHGIAFTISPSTNFTKASPAQFLGLLNSNNNGNTSNHLLAIELDTVNTTEFNDINDNHVGIDVNSLESIVSAPASYYSNSEGKTKVWSSQYNEAARPSMRQVMQYLDGNVLLPDIPLHTTGMGAFSVTNEPSSEFVASFPSSVSKSSVQLMSITESILNSGR